MVDDALWFHPLHVAYKSGFNIIFLSSGWIPGGGPAEVGVEILFQLFRNYQTAFENGCPVMFPPAVLKAQSLIVLHAA